LILSFNKIINQFRKTIDTNLKKIYFQGPSNMVETANFVMSAKGKRIRPVLTMMSCDVLGGKVEQSIDVGIAIELLHNFTLVHDDIMDGDSMRHGQPTVHKKWDIGTGVLTGDSLLWLSLHVLRNVDYDREQILLKFIDAIKIVCEGQAYDKMFESKDYITTNEYESMISMKTGYMIGLCSELGAICSKSDADIQQKMKEYGLEIGKAYQIQDDYMEMYSTEKIMKKSLKSDIELNKKTYMVCLASDIDPIGLSDILNSRQSSKHKMKLLRKYFEELNVKDRVIEEIDKSFKKAETILREIDFKKDYLFKLNEYLKNRRY
tara:strand:- start:6262 stop:7221 length:960 start_codon:yes stop_codon:yes gene_type:complete